MSRRVLSFVGAAVLSIATSHTLHAQSPQPTAVALDSADVAAFVERFLATLPPADRVPRAAFVLVQGTRTTLARGYGMTMANRAVDPERTLFRAASNSKLVVATAVMQLVEQRAWSLDDDVNRYLPREARLDVMGRTPVTIAHLLTHTAGFEDRFAGGITTVDRRLPLAEYFARYRPRRVRIPGGAVSYSNTGMALAGYLVEIVSRQSFDAYAEEHIFGPLGMTRSTFRQPLPASWRDDLATAPPRNRGELAFNPYPAASLVSTPADMGRLIAAHLGETSIGGPDGRRRVLGQATLRAMHASHWRAQPTAPGVAYGFFETTINGRLALFHTGDSGDHSLVFLLPDERVGFYLVYSGEDSQVGVREQFTRAFIDRYFPDLTHDASTVDRAAFATATEVRQLVGTYRGTAYSRSNYEKLRAMFNQVTVAAGDNGVLLVVPPGGSAASPLRLRLVAPLTFRGDSGEVVAFRRSPAGKIIGLTLSGFIWDPSSWDPIGPFENGRLHSVMLAVAFLILLGRQLFWPIGALVRRLRRRPSPVRSATERRWWRWSGAASALMLFAPIAAAATALLSFQHPAIAIPRGVNVLTCLWLAGVIVGIPLVAFAPSAWRRRYWHRGRRIHFALIGLAFLILTPLLAYWRLLGPQP